jgi:hypothetical protein
VENKLKKKFEVPGGCSTLELTRFDELLRKISNVPNEESGPSLRNQSKKKKAAKKTR